MVDTTSETGAVSRPLRAEAVEAPDELDNLEPDARERGRVAQRPSEIPLRGWQDVLYRVVQEVSRDHLSIVSAGIAFFALLALIPGLIALISLYGLLLDPHDVARQVSSLSTIMPPSGRMLIQRQLSSIVESSPAQLSVGLLVSVGGSLFVASNGVMALLQGINLAYDEPETRSYVKLRGRAFLFTATIVLFVVVAVPSITLLHVVVDWLGFSGWAEVLIRAGRWPVLAAFVATGLAYLYRTAPNRRPPKWRWVSYGAVLATIIWLLASLAFAWYAQNFARFNQTYGTLAGVVVLLLWLYVSSIAILLGAELNAELEHQTARDSTVGSDRPMGERGAFVADHLGSPKPASTIIQAAKKLPERLSQLPSSLRRPSSKRG